MLTCEMWKKRTMKFIWYVPFGCFAKKVWWKLIWSRVQNGTKKLIRSRPKCRSMFVAQIMVRREKRMFIHWRKQKIRISRFGFSSREANYATPWIVLLCNWKGNRQLLRKQKVHLFQWHFNMIAIVILSFHQSIWCHWEIITVHYSN